MINQTTPDASIIMPTYNRAYIIKKAIKSVLDQTHNNWELIIIDDGSTDETESIVKSFNDERINYQKQLNKGPSAARNLGVSIAKSKWVVYLDSDDVLYANFLEIMLGEIGKNPQAVFAIPRADRTLALYKSGRLLTCFDNSNDLPAKVNVKDIFMKTFHFSCDGFMHKRDIFDDKIHWDENLWHMEEWDLAMYIGEKYPNGFLYVPEILCSYQQRHGADGIASNTSYLEWADAFRYIYTKHKNDTMLQGQTWYPQREKKWRKIDQDYKKGLMPPPHLYFFPEYFSSQKSASAAPEPSNTPVRR